MNDIVTRLRVADRTYTESWSQQLMEEAADEIERLRKLISDYVSLWLQVETTTSGASSDVSKSYYAAFHAMKEEVRRG